MLDKVGVVFTLMQGSYEGGDFCSGLTIGFEATHLLMTGFGGPIKEQLEPLLGKQPVLE